MVMVCAIRTSFWHWNLEFEHSDAGDTDEQTKPYQEVYLSVMGSGQKQKMNKIISENVYDLISPQNMYVGTWELTRNS